MPAIKRKSFKMYDVAVFWNEAPSGFYDENLNNISVLSFLDIFLSYPQCFACGYSKFEDVEYDLEKQMNNWTHSRLERHHYNPLSSGGADEIQNIVLLCKECHSKAPTVPLTLQEILLWCASQQSHIERVWLEATQSFDRMLQSQFATDEERNHFKQWFSDLGEKGLKDIARQFTEHNKVSSYFSKMPYDTIPYLALRAYKQRQIS